eukprot:TRINITY_DN93529_c0_g1_i1.p2 TRINITY_DN93529_c0_g1~~TRINITY_DN93529_c0_g1_i1.p2  ORF type:complete len:133 (-),score=12.80 TRINITY_DN93529_c0_g1_i1:109-507(-)
MMSTTRATCPKWRRKQHDCLLAWQAQQCGGEAGEVMMVGTAKTKDMGGGMAGLLMGMARRAALAHTTIQTQSLLVGRSVPGTRLLVYHRWSRQQAEAEEGCLLSECGSSTSSSCLRIWWESCCTAAVSAVPQ